MSELAKALWGDTVPYDCEAPVRLPHRPGDMIIPPEFIQDPRRLQVEAMGTLREWRAERDGGADRAGRTFTDPDLRIRAIQLIQCGYLASLQTWIDAMRNIQVAVRTKDDLRAWCELQLHMTELVEEAFRFGRLRAYVETNGKGETRDLIVEADVLMLWLAKGDPKHLPTISAMLRGIPDVGEPESFQDLRPDLARQVVYSAWRYMRKLGGQDLEDPVDVPNVRAARNCLRQVITWCGESESIKQMGDARQAGTKLSPKNRKARTITPEQAMQRILERNHDAGYWTVRQWKDATGFALATIQKTELWKKCLGFREAKKAEKRKPKGWHHRHDEIREERAKDKLRHTFDDDE